MMRTIIPERQAQESPGFSRREDVKEHDAPDNAGIESLIGELGDSSAPAMDDPAVNARARRRRRRQAGFLVGLSVTAVVAALVILGVLLFAPQKAEQAYGEVTTLLNEAGTAISGEPPVITLGADGNESTMDRCDGTFTHMVEYDDVAGLQPLWAAHNKCRGDVILGWQVGQTVKVEGGSAPGLYMVVDRKVELRGVTAGELRGMAGDFILQSCFYGSKDMLFLGLSPQAPAEVSAHDATTTP